MMYEKMWQLGYLEGSRLGPLQRHLASPCGQSIAFDVIAFGKGGASSPSPSSESSEKKFPANSSCFSAKS